MKLPSLWIVVFGLSALAFVTPARADVVGPPPAECPAGTEGASCHGGPYCRPVGCAGGVECASGETCREVPFCVATILCAGLLPPDADLADYERSNVVGSCANGGTCAQDATCKTLQVCVPVSASTVSASSSGSEGGCGCRLAPATPLDASLGALAFGALGAVSLLRRRQRVEEASRASRQRRA